MSGRRGRQDSDEARRQHRRAWFWTLGVGCVIVAIGNTLGWSPWLIAILVSGAMVLLVVVLRDTDVTGDAKGDSIYYLGFLFTLVALIAALISFDAESDTISMLGVLRNLGIALVTTIVGLAGRIWYTMAQESPGDVEEAVRRDLEQAVSEMKSRLERVRSQLDTMGLQFQRSANDMGDTTASIAKTASEAVRTSQALGRYAEVLAQTTRSFSEAMVQGQEAFRRAVEERTQAARRLHESLDGIAGSAASLGREMESTGSRVSAFRDTMRGAQEQAAPAAESIQEARDGLVATATESAALRETIVDLRRNAQQVKGTVMGVSPLAEKAGHRLRSTAHDADRAGGRMRDLVTHAQSAESALLDASESVSSTRGRISQAGRNARLLGERLAAADGELAATAALTKREAADLTATMSKLTNASVALSDKLGTATERVEQVSEELENARARIAHTSPAGRLRRRLRGVLSRRDRDARVTEEA